MKTIWTSVKDEQLKRDIRASFAGSLVVRKRLQEILVNKIYSNDKSSMMIDEYDCPNWAYRQADRQGYKRALNEVISLLSDKD